MQELLGRWMPANAAAHGAELDQLLGLVHWLMALLFVGWSVYFVIVLLKFRSGKNPQANYAGVKNHTSSYLEVGIVLVEVILLVGFAIPAWAKWVTPHEPESDSLEVRVVGEQFAWNVHYPGPDGVFGMRRMDLIDSTNPLGLDRESDPYAEDDVTTINQLHLPVDRPVTIYLSSKDVIHSFYLPHLRVKQDAIPGMEIPVHFEAVSTTPEAATVPKCVAEKTCWEIGCAQLCGLGHYRMRGFYKVHSQESFDTWMTDQVARVVGVPAAPEPASDPEEADPATAEDAEAAA